MSPDDVLSFLFDHSLFVFGGLIVAAAIVIWKVGRPRRWFAWVFDALAVWAIIVAVVALTFFTSVASAIDHRLGTLSFASAPNAARQKLGDYRGKVVVVNYWATWCGPCRYEIPDLNRLAESWRGRDDVVVLALTDEDFGTIEKFQTRFPIRARVAQFTSDAPQTMIQKICYGGRPTTVVVGRDGRVVKRFIGAKSFAEFDAAVRSALARPPARS